MKNTIVSPSVLSADFMNLQKAIEMLNQSSADWVHLDIMDGVFVPNITFGMPVIKQIKDISKKPLDVHLMIVQPERYIKEFRNCGADILTVQYEACVHLHRTVQEIKNNGMKAGVAINPHTNVMLLEDILSELDLVLVMSVNPGFGGQSFIKQSLQKIAKLKEMAETYNPLLTIEVDGGVSLLNYKEIVKAGANALVAGNAVFNYKNPIEAIEILKN